MIYLIGGPPRCGKTTLAKSLSAALGCGWIPIDAIEIIVSQETSKRVFAKRFPKTVLCERTGWENDPLYTTTPINTIVHAYITQGTSSWKATEQFIQHCLHEGHDFILEGHQIHPEFVHRLLRHTPNDIRVVFLYKKDIPHLLEGFNRNRGAVDWVTQKTKDPSILPRIAEMLSTFGNWFFSQAETYHLPSQNMDVDFEKTIRRLTRRMAHGDLDPS